MFLCAAHCVYSINNNNNNGCKPCMLSVSITFLYDQPFFRLCCMFSSKHVAVSGFLQLYAHPNSYPKASKHVELFWLWHVDNFVGVSVVNFFPFLVNSRMKYAFQAKSLTPVLSLRSILLHCDLFTVFGPSVVASRGILEWWDLFILCDAFEAFIRRSIYCLFKIKQPTITACMVAQAVV